MGGGILEPVYLDFVFWIVSDSRAHAVGRIISELACFGLIGADQN